MFKKLPMGMAALTFFKVGDCEAIQLKSVPNCTSYECHNNMVTIGYAGPEAAAEEEAKPKAVKPVKEKNQVIKGDKGAAMQIGSDSDPAWNSADG